MTLRTLDQMIEEIRARMQQEMNILLLELRENIKVFEENRKKNEMAVDKWRIYSNDLKKRKQGSSCTLPPVSPLPPAPSPPSPLPPTTSPPPPPITSPSPSPPLSGVEARRGSLLGSMTWEERLHSTLVEVGQGKGYRQPPPAQQPPFIPPLILNNGKSHKELQEQNLLLPDETNADRGISVPVKASRAGAMTMNQMSKPPTPPPPLSPPLSSEIVAKNRETMKLISDNTMSMYSRSKPPPPPQPPPLLAPSPPPKLSSSWVLQVEEPQTEHQQMVAELTTPLKEVTEGVNLGHHKNGLKRYLWAKISTLGSPKSNQKRDMLKGNNFYPSPVVVKSFKGKDKLNPREIKIESTITHSIPHSATLASFLTIAPPLSLFHINSNLEKLIPGFKSTIATPVASQSISSLLTNAPPRTISQPFLPAFSRKGHAPLKCVCQSKTEEGLKLDESEDIVVEFLCSFVTGEVRWTTNLEIIMEAQEQGNLSIVDYMSDMKTWEIHPDNTPPTDDSEYNSSQVAVRFKDMQGGNDERYGDIDAVDTGPVDMDIPDIPGETKPHIVDYKARCYAAAQVKKAIKVTYYYYRSENYVFWVDFESCQTLLNTDVKGKLEQERVSFGLLLLHASYFHEDMLTVADGVVKRIGRTAKQGDVSVIDHGGAEDKIKRTKGGLKLEDTEGEQQKHQSLKNKFEGFYVYFLKPLRLHFHYELAGVYSSILLLLAHTSFHCENKVNFGGWGIAKPLIKFKDANGVVQDESEGHVNVECGKKQVAQIRNLAEMAGQDFEKEKSNERIATLAGGRVVAVKDLCSDTPEFGHNVTTGTYEEWLVVGFLDSMEVVRCCLEHAPPAANTLDTIRYTFPFFHLEDKVNLWGVGNVMHQVYPHLGVVWETQINKE